MIAHCPPSDQIGSLLVFSDDWGRHPSSCQHLVGNLLDRYPVLWVNTIGTRAPRLDVQTLKRVAEKLSQWGSGKLTRARRSLSGASQIQSVSKKDSPSLSHKSQTHPNLQVVNPKMWPWFSSDRDRRLNRWLLSKQLAQLIQQLPQPVFAVTTLPITADLPDSLPVERWIYYCVDDFSQWPGLDGETLRRMDQDMIQKADALIAVSETLQAMIAKEGRSSSLLTHGVDVDFWSSQSISPLRADSASRWPDLARTSVSTSPTELRQTPKLCVVNDHFGEPRQTNESPRDNKTIAALATFKSERATPEYSDAVPVDTPSTPLDDIPGPRIVFWGVIDRRMDSASLIRLSDELIEGTIILIGPQQNPDPAVLALPNVRTLPAQPLSALPAIAEQADVLIMPYADLPVTRAMQPLKLKEYIATGKAVVVNRLPSTDSWSDCLDVAESPEEFSQIVRNRVYSGISVSQGLARCRLQQESWKSKSERFEHLLKCEKPVVSTSKSLPPIIAFKTASKVELSECNSRPEQ